jgi:hypothetical protein
MQKLARSLCRSKELAKNMLEVEPGLEILYNAMPNIPDDMCEILVLNRRLKCMKKLPHLRCGGK